MEDRLLAARFFSKGHLDERSVIRNAKGKYNDDRVGKKASRLITPAEFQENNRLPPVYPRMD